MPGEYFWNPWNLTDNLWDVKFVELFLICAVTDSRPSDSEPICQESLDDLGSCWGNRADDLAGSENPFISYKIIIALVGAEISQHSPEISKTKRL